MKTNKLYNNIKEKFENRTLEPSVSAWERLSAQLDEQPQTKKKGWFFYIGYAASILVLISAGFYFFSDNELEITPNEIIVNQQIDTTSILNKIDKVFNEIPVEEAIVENEEIDSRDKRQDKKRQNEEKQENKFIAIKKTVVIPTKEESHKVKTNKNDKITIAKVEENLPSVIPTKEESKNLIKETKNSRIKVNSDDLLYAVTHTPQEVTAYYAKNNVSREDILKTIKSELKKSNLKVNPETILAEVERTINDDVFQNNFLKSLKKRVSNIANAIASRND